MLAQCGTHSFVAALAFLLHRAIEMKLKAARLDLSATEALTILKSIRVVDIDLATAQQSAPSRPAPSVPQLCCAPSVSPTSPHPSANIRPDRDVVRVPGHRDH